MPDLETVDLEGVEIMAAGERVWGKGSPPEGDLYDVAALERLAANTNAVLEQVKPFVKLGHNPAQRLLKSEGFYDGDDQPQTGRLHNFRVDGQKLKTDIKGMPRKLADLVTARAFPSRSAELFAHTDGEQEREIVGRLAFLGAKPSAFKTLADVVALYADQPVGEEDVRVVVHPGRESPDAVDAIIAAFADALAGPPTPAPADSTRRMGDTDHTLRSFAEAVGLEGEASSDQILDAVKQLVADKTAAETKATEADGKVKEYSDAFAVIRADAEQGKAAHEELRVMKRDRLFADAVQSKRIAPAQVDDLVKQYDESPIKAEAITVLVGGLQPRTDLTTPDGRDPDEEQKQREAEKAYALFEAEEEGE